MNESSSSTIKELNTESNIIKKRKDYFLILKIEVYLMKFLYNKKI